MSEETPTEYDLLIITDATASMWDFLHALNDSLPKIIAVSALTSSFARIGVLAYRDYCSGELIEWSGWYGKEGTIDRDMLIQFAKNLTADAGGDWPEATKTALARAYSVMRSDAKTLILLYTDAPPHMPWNTQENRTREQKSLSANEHGEVSNLFADWASAVRTLKDSDKKAQIFTIAGYNATALTPYVYMCHETSGAFFELSSIDANTISSLTMSILLAWLGVGKAGTSSDLGASLQTYKDAKKITGIRTELDPLAKKYFQAPRINFVLQGREVDDETLRSVIKGLDRPVQNFEKRYIADSSYRAEVVEHLGKIIEEDVSAVAINPIFGSLWRTVCNDRTSDARDLLISKFGASIERITGQEQKQRMKRWLEESYNYEAEIMSILEQVAPEDRYPCIFLDPTEDWSASDEKEDDETSTHGPNQLTRAELLEIGRSCDNRILRRLGRVLIRLTYVDSEDSVPAHIAAASTEIPKMPLALAQPKYKRVLWKILLHLVCPGTKLAERPAALVAALSIRMGMKPLMAAADAEMLNWCNKWNNLEIPETWNVGCLSLILDADRSFEARREQGELPDSIGSFLSSDDRQLFQRLVDYSLLTANMSTSLQARIGWHPEKSKVSIGPLVTCKKCKYPRSVTVMAPRGVCGLCACDPESFGGKSKDKSVRANVTKGDTENSEATWVECSVRACHAQYVIYNPETLNMRAKCHYCRMSGQEPLTKPKLAKAKSGKLASAKPTTIKPTPGKRASASTTVPWVECSICLSRVIWPHEYRPVGLSVKDFRCPACLNGRDTIVTVEPTTRELANENGTAWLLRNENNKIPDALTTRSLFKTVMASGTEDFATSVEILPTSDTADLKCHGKLVRNTVEVKSALWGWIRARRSEGGTCSLCFSTFNKQDLRSACGRSGCQQPICNSCRQGWYGINRRGRIINIAALSCPFCRRQPAVRAVSGAAGGITSLGNLRNAVDEAGSWIYAWCDSCGVAKRFMERACAQGPPPELREWECEECEERKKPKEKPDEPVLDIRSCPGCGVSTERTGGCGHITCAVRRCKTHWCYFCGTAVDPARIYDHMAKEHGGWYGTVRVSKPRR
ncbi:hypothetical protein EKO27_g1933 [Xylaria grammica]|uniref:RBR-type E3 ubiquitin transferase n=1 Tax=Xylaria grammica TaxID=363999 RepID=A0A439DFE1_9PEZI|nr:hypothetical protein EKO27_g1933 [Xylaria grammica]